MWRVELKEHQVQLGKCKWAKNGKSVDIMLQMTESVCNSGWMVTMDSGFSVFNVILELDRVGVFDRLGKKTVRYWAKSVPGNQRDAHVVDKLIGHSKTLKQTIDGKYFLFTAHKMISCNKDYVYPCSVDCSWVS